MKTIHMVIPKIRNSYEEDFFFIVTMTIFEKSIIRLHSQKAMFQYYCSWFPKNENLLVIYSGKMDANP